MPTPTIEARVQEVIALFDAIPNASWSDHHDYRDRAIAALRSLAASATQGETVKWLPIETAPQQDDYSFLVRRSPRGKNWTYTMQVSRFEGNMYPDHLDSNVDFDDRVTDATHWAPMLPAPAPSKEQTNG